MITKNFSKLLSRCIKVTNSGNTVRPDFPKIPRCLLPSSLDQDLMASFGKFWQMVVDVVRFNNGCGHWDEIC